MTLGVKEIKELMQALAQNGLTEMKLEQDDYTLRLRRGSSAVTAEAAAAGESAFRVEAALISSEPESARGSVVCSPIVGTFYSRPTPEAEPFVRVGDQVHQGDVLFIIESMKLMNEVTSELDGTVAEVLAQSGSPVEYGQPLMRII